MTLLSNVEDEVTQKPKFSTIYIYIYMYVSCFYCSVCLVIFSDIYILFLYLHICILFLWQYMPLVLLLVYICVSMIDSTVLNLAMSPEAEGDQIHLNVVKVL